MNLSGKKLLVLGGSMATYAIVENAKELGAITYVADMKTTGEAYRIADIGVQISTTDIDALAEYIKSEKIDGIFCGPSEFNIQNAMKLATASGLRFYANQELWDKCGNKQILKDYCRKNKLPEIPCYSCLNADKISEKEFPVIVKPVDGCSSKGVSVCRNREELEKAVSSALEFSQSGNVVVEKYLDNGGQLFSFRYVLDGDNVYPYFLMDTYIADPENKKSLISAFTISPSKYSSLYLEKTDEKVRSMIRDMGLEHGVCFAQALPYGNEFYVHDMGYRLSGGMVYKMTDALYGINDMKMMIRYALGDSIISDEEKSRINLLADNKYVGQLMIPLDEGEIASIEGFESIEKMPEVIQLIQYYHEGDTIDKSVIGTLGQHLARIAFCTKTREEMLRLVEEVQSGISVKNPDGRELFNMRFDVNRAK